VEVTLCGVLADSRWVILSCHPLTRSADDLSEDCVWRQGGNPWARSRVNPLSESLTRFIRSGSTWPSGDHVSYGLSDPRGKAGISLINVQVFNVQASNLKLEVRILLDPGLKITSCMQQIRYLDASTGGSSCQVSRPILAIRGSPGAKAPGCTSSWNVT